jgi:hypothetical protein
MCIKSSLLGEGDLGDEVDNLQRGGWGEFMKRIARHFVPCVPLRGSLTKKKPCSANALLRPFCLLQASGKPGLVSNKKALPFHGKAFSL